MFQTFTTSAEPAAAKERLKRLRTLMADQGLAALLVPRGDEHQGEYIAPSSERLRWLTGFTGSAGVGAITLRAGALFVDGRYTIQARAECDAGCFELPGLARAKLTDWLKSKLKAGDTIGFDPWLHMLAEVERLGRTLAAADLKLKPARFNLVDRIWGEERPGPPMAPISPYPLKYSGRPAAAKLADIQKTLKDEGQHAVVLTLPDSIAWTFNIRGADVAHNPVVLAFAIIPAQGKAELFVAPEKVGREARAHLEPVAKLSKPEALKPRLVALRKAGKRVRLDAERTAWWFGRVLGPKAVARGADPSIALKAIKNAVEIKNARVAHVRDGGALVRFLAWLDREVHAKTRIDEIAAVRQLEAFRAETQALKEISFDTISGSGPNGAIVHYRVTEKTNRTLREGELFLLDSGAQYLDGTTDVTRTVAIGTPTPEMRERFTVVLKGHIALASARFPKETRGVDLDPFARRALWEKGLDYDHGTGHGVGSYLSVHEGPQSISRVGIAALVPGMITSNEPGYYKEGAYGIRIESLVLVREPEKPAGGDQEMLDFETLTLVPIDRRLIVTDLLTAGERSWLDSYHARVLDVVGPHVDGASRAWLEAACAPL